MRASSVVGSSEVWRADSPSIIFADKDMTDAAISNEMIKNQAVMDAVRVIGSQQKLADLCGVQQPHINNWIYNVVCPADRACQIEHATKGEITREMIRPDVLWHRNYT